MIFSFSESRHSERSEESLLQRFHIRNHIFDLRVFKNILERRHQRVAIFDPRLQIFVGHLVIVHRERTALSNAFQSRPDLFRVAGVVVAGRAFLLEHFLSALDRRGIFGRRRLFRCFCLRERCAGYRQRNPKGNRCKRGPSANEVTIHDFSPVLQTVVLNTTLILSI